jgi:hypothetical protein
MACPAGLFNSTATPQIEGKESPMPPRRFFMLLALVMGAAALTVGVAALLPAGVAGGWAIVPLLAAGALLAWRRT